MEVGSSTGSALFELLLERWYNLPLVQLKYYGAEIPPDLRYAVGRVLVELGCVPLEDRETSYKLFTNQTSDELERKIVAEINVHVHRDERLVDFRTFSCGEEIIFSIPADHLNFENLSLVLSEILKRTGFEPSLSEESAESTETKRAEFQKTVPDTVFVGRDGELKIIPGYGLPLLVSRNLDYVPGMVTFSGEVYDPKLKFNTQDDLLRALYEIPIVTSGARQLYVDRMIEGTRTIWNNLRVLAIWDNIVLFADGSVSDSSLSWRMKVSQTPVDFLVYDGLLTILDVAGNFYVLDIKTRRIIYNDRFPDFKRLGRTESGILIETTDRVLEFGKTLKKKVVSSFREPSGTDRYLYSQPVYPSVTRLFRTNFGIFLEDTFIGNEVFFFFVKSNKMFLLTDVGTWVLDLQN
ncbi:hypothetical protein A4H02_03040 [Fervidobacterium thailandense]|uniref:Uncharacterized protein n=1 Tax=Fervidobacterium thailandense TaxID=1008305 RepID=A0A1E3G3M6_9BACT|nr:hypothetical protein A4H02_03040 [Fervidobacterium thailandense]